MMRYLYLISIILSTAGVVTLDRRLATGVASLRFARTAALTVPLFLIFDLVGAARGWFSSDPRRNVLIVSPGVSLEEPVLLTFLTLLSLVLWRAGRRFLP